MKLEITDKIIPISLMFSFKDIKFCDLETNGLYGEPKLLAVKHKKTIHLITNPDLEQLKKFVLDNHTVWYNAHYDLSVIKKYCELTDKQILDKIKFDDLFLLAKLKFIRLEKLGLEEVLTYFLGHNPYAEVEIDKKKMQKANWNNPDKTMLKYASLDVMYLDKLYEYLKPVTETVSYRLDMLTLRYCLMFQDNGIPIDKERAEKTYQELKEKAESISLPFNVNSPKQVKEFFNSLGVRQDHFAEVDLRKLTFTESKVKDYAQKTLEKRKALKLISFLNKFRDSNGDYSNRIYGKFSPKTKSGRLASFDQNLQQLPRELKHIFGFTPEDGKVLVYSDFAQLELRCVCAVTGEPRMAHYFKTDQDLHSETAKMIFGVDEVTKDLRQLAKSANFALLYGASTAGFLMYLNKISLNISPEKADMIRRKWLQVYSVINKWQTAGKKAWLNQKAWQTPLGRPYIAKRYTDQLNIQIQGFGAEVSKLAWHYAWKELKHYSENVRLINWVHDSFILEVSFDMELIERVSEILAKAMQKGWHEGCKKTKLQDIPMPVEVVAGLNWGDIEKGEVIFQKTYKD